MIREPYLLQRCAACMAGHYCEGNGQPALKCGGDTFSEPLSTSADACVESEFVELIFNMPLSAEEFSNEMQLDFIACIAETVGINSTYVSIDFAQTSGRRSERRTWFQSERPTQRHPRHQSHQRKLVSASLDIETRIASTDNRAQELLNKLTEDSLNQALKTRGLPTGVFTRAPSIVRKTTESTHSQTSGLQ